MTLIIRDSFDFYTAASDAALGQWDSADTNMTMLPTASTRFTSGQGIATSTASGSGVSQLAKAFGSNETTVFWAFAFQRPSALGGTAANFVLRYYDGTTVQCSVSFNNNGDINFYRGDVATLLGTYTSGYTAATWTQFQIKVVINATTGSFEVRKNGNTSDDLSLTGVNNRTTANTQINKVDIDKNATSQPAYWVDDMAVWSGSGSGTWSDWIGDFRAQQVMPNVDTVTKVFTPNASTIALGVNTQTGTRSLTLNTQFAVQEFVSTIPGTIAKITLAFNAAATGHVVVGIYDNTGSGGTPGSLVTHGTSNVVTNPVIGANDFVFSTPPTLTLNASYYVVILADVTIVVKSDSANHTFYEQTEAYSSGLVTPMTPVAQVNVPMIAAQIVVTPSGNFAYVQELAQDGTISYLTDSTAGDFDLYANPGLPTSPSSILGLTLRGFIGKSDAGARTGTLRMKSGATSVDGATQTLSTTLQNITVVQDVDPNTSAAWTAAAVAALTFGPKVVA